MSYLQVVNFLAPRVIMKEELILVIEIPKRDIGIDMERAETGKKNQDR